MAECIGAKASENPKKRGTTLKMEKASPSRPDTYAQIYMVPHGRRLESARAKYNSVCFNTGLHIFK
jgi:hypothetical protein